MNSNSKNKKNIHSQNNTATDWCILHTSIEFTQIDTKHRNTHNSTGIHRDSHRNTHKYTHIHTIHKGIHTGIHTIHTMDTETPVFDTPPNTYIYTHPQDCTPQN